MNYPLYKKNGIFGDMFQPWSANMIKKEKKVHKNMYKTIQWNEKVTMQVVMIILGFRQSDKFSFFKNIYIYIYWC